MMVSFLVSINSVVDFSDEKMKGKLGVDNLNDFAKAIFQNKYYTHDTVYFVVDNTLYDFNR